MAQCLELAKNDHQKELSVNTLFAQKKILVAGDAMLDRYWFGDANRISPEAPVPVVHVTRCEDRLGGAANVALNIAALGAQAQLLSVVGCDEAGETVERILLENKITPHLHRDPEIKTIVKLRIVARQQQMLRADFENRPTTAVLANHLSEYESIIDNCDVVVLSDYGKGGLDHIAKMIELARQRNVPILIDPKGSNYDRYSGATLITPNRAELAQVVGEWTSEEDLTQRAQALRERLNLTAVLLTRSEEGMTLYTASGQTSVPAQALEVFDVSGAGDTVIAVMATMIAMKKTLEESMRIANRAGGIVVGKLGTATVSFEELFADGLKEFSLETQK